MSFFGAESVLSTMEKQPGRASGTLKIRAAADTFTSVSWAQAYIRETEESSAIEGGGIQPITTTGYLYQTGESDSYRPRPDDQFVDASGNTWLITRCVGRLTKDSGYGVFDCSFTRVA